MPIDYDLEYDYIKWTGKINLTLLNYMQRLSWLDILIHVYFK